MKRYTADYIYTLDSDKPLLNSYIEVDDSGKILAINELSGSIEGVEYIKGAIVPGFVNSHCHIELSYLYGKFKKGTGMAGFIDQINEMRDNKSLDEKLEDISHWMQVLYDQGVVAMADISNCSDSFDIKSKSPIYTRTFLEVFGTEPEDCPKVIESVKRLNEEADRFKIDAAPTPHSCYTMSTKLLTESSRLGLQKNYLSFHSEESDQEEDMMMFGKGKMYENRKASGMTMPPVTGTSSLKYFIDCLEKIHKPPFNENVLLVHEVCMTREGMQEVKSKFNNAYIALCPLSNIFIHNALPPVDVMMDEGMKLTIGTDSLSSNDTLNMVKEMYCISSNFKNINLGDLLIFACKNGAEFLGKQDVLGTLSLGKKPGIVAITNLDDNGQLTASSSSYRVI